MVLTLQEMIEQTARIHAANPQRHIDASAGIADRMEEQSAQMVERMMNHAGPAEEVGYFARCAVQLARNAQQIRLMGFWSQRDGEHDLWCKKEAAKTYAQR